MLLCFFQKMRLATSLLLWGWTVKAFRFQKPRSFRYVTLLQGRPQLTVSLRQGWDAVGIKERGVLSKDVPKRGGKEGRERLVRVLQPPVCACYRVRRGNEAHRQASVVKREMACDCSDAQGRPPATDQDTGRPLAELVPGDGGPELNSEGTWEDGGQERGGS
ncbi:uncharacterized protein LOC144306156 isoform X2 [Canis aureus]